MTAVHETGALTRIRRRGLGRTVTRGVQRAFEIPIVYIAAALLRRKARNVHSVDEALALAYGGFRFGGVTVWPWQEPTEIKSLLEAVAELSPSAILEIGTSNGGTLFMFSRVAAPDALIVSVDLPHGEFGGGYPPWRAHLYKSFASAAQRIRLLRADSHDPQTLDTVKAALGGRPLDALFIDGDHTYEGVKQDFQMYAPLVREGGLIAFHDIVPPSVDGPRPWGDGDDLQGGEVPDFWKELRASRDVTEYVADWSSGRFGIGVIRAGSPTRVDGDS